MPQGVSGGDQPQHGDLGHDDHRRQLRQPDVRASTRAPASWCGRRRSWIRRRRRAPSSGPIIANGKVIAGRQCQPDATHDACVITAHDAKTGKELWRTRTIPRPGEPGNETWGDVPLEQRWHVGTWMVPSYDPQTNLIIVGTSVTIPAPKFMLGGNDKQHLYHNSTLAIDADTGKIVWHYQHVVDHWDLDHPFERIIVGHGGRARRRRGALDQPAHQAGRAAPGDHRHPGQDRDRLHARPRAPASSCGRGRR